MIEGHRQGRYDAQGNVQKGVVGWCGCVFFCSVGVVVFSAGAHGFSFVRDSSKSSNDEIFWPLCLDNHNC